MSVQHVQGKNVRLALVQLGGTGPDKAANLSRARSKVLEAAKHASKPQMIMLPECFQSPYAVDKFAEYAEDIGYTEGEPFDAASSPSESVRMLSALAKETSTYLVGGVLST